MHFATASLPLRGMVCMAVTFGLLLAVPAAALAQAAGGKKGIFRWEEHPTIKAGQVTIMFRARFQADSDKSAASTENPDAPVLDIAKRRVGVEGALGKYAEYEATFDLDDEDEPWRDLYL